MITQVLRMNKVEGLGKTRAYADILVNGVVIKGCRLVEGISGMFLSMPGEKNKEGKWFDICYINDDVVKGEITNKVIEAYNNPA